jgi:hypothetical protein
MSFSISGLFHSIGTVLHNFFTKNGGAIQTGLTEAAAAAGVAASVAAITLSPADAAPVVAEIAKVQDAIGIVQKGVTAESTATDLSAHAANLAGVVTSLVTSGDIGVKNAQVQAAVGVAATKVQSVIGVLENAATVAPAASAAPAA